MKQLCFQLQMWYWLVGRNSPLTLKHTNSSWEMFGLMEHSYGELSVTLTSIYCSASKISNKNHDVRTMVCPQQSNGNRPTDIFSKGRNVAAQCRLNDWLKTNLNFVAKKLQTNRQNWANWSVLNPINWLSDSTKSYVILCTESSSKVYLNRKWFNGCISRLLFRIDSLVLRVTLLDNRFWAVILSLRW